MADLAQDRGVEVVEKAADLDAVLRQMGKPAHQMSPAVQDGLADLSVHRRAHRYTDEAVRFPMSKRDRLMTACRRALSREIRRTVGAMNINRDLTFDGRTCSRSCVVVVYIVIVVLFFFFFFLLTIINVMGLSNFKDLKSILHYASNVSSESRTTHFSDFLRQFFFSHTHTLHIL